MAEARNSKTSGTAPSVDGVAPDATTAQAVPASDTPKDAILDTQPESRGEDAVKARLHQLAQATPAGEARPLVRNGAPVYPGPMDSPLPEPGPEDLDVRAGGQQRAQVLFNRYRVNLGGDRGRVSAKRGQTIRVSVAELARGVELGGLRSLE